MKKITLLALIFLLINISAQKKAGLILPKDENDINTAKYCCVLSPDSGFTLYDHAGIQIGMIQRPDKTKNDQNAYKIFVKRKNGKINQYQHAEAVGYDVLALKFTQTKSGFLRLSGKEDLWLNMAEVKKKNFNPKS